MPYVLFIIGTLVGMDIHTLDAEYTTLLICLKVIYYLMSVVLVGKHLSISSSNRIKILLISLKMIL